MGLVLDASVLIEWERGRLDLPQRIVDRANEPFFLPVIAVSELLHGVHRAKTPELRATRSAFVEAVIEKFPILPVDTSVARTRFAVRHARLKGVVRRRARLMDRRNRDRQRPYRHHRKHAGFRTDSWINR